MKGGSSLQAVITIRVDDCVPEQDTAKVRILNNLITCVRIVGFGILGF